MKLQISSSLALPADAISQKMAFLGRTGGGKTYAAQKLAEEMAKAGLQFVVLDPVGVWYGLRIAANGKDPGIQIPVFGGLHGDIPIESTGGALMADIISDRGISAVIDVSQFETDAAKNRFAQAFAERFFFRRKAAPAPVFIFLEEAQEFCPQNPQAGEQQMLHAFTRMWKLGRNYGIGGGLISQRPQEINKKVLNMTECMFAFQMTGPHERKTIESWVKEKGASLDIVDILPRLEIGQAHVWSPQWLRISETVKIGTKWTFNASSTPVSGGKRTEPKPLDNADMERIKTAMADTIERAKADDPRELRAIIRRLEMEVETVDTVSVEKARTAGYGDGFHNGVAAQLAVDSRAVAGLVLKAVDVPSVPVQYQVFTGPPKAAVQHKSPQVFNGASSVGQTGLRRIMIALAQVGRPLTAAQVGVRAQLSSGSGTFGTYLGTGRSNGWITGSRDALEITNDGLKALGSYDPLPEGAALLNYWLGDLGNSGASRILSELAAVYPKSLTAEQVGERAGISSASGTFGTYLGKLRSLELIEGSRSALVASKELF